MVTHQTRTRGLHTTRQATEATHSPGMANYFCVPGPDSFNRYQLSPTRTYLTTPSNPFCILQVKNKMVVHMDARSKEILALKRENAELRARVEHLEGMMALGGAGAGPGNAAGAGHEEETISNNSSSSSSLSSKANSSRTAVSTSPAPKSPPPVPPRPVR